MTITLRQARPLCTKSELELVQWSTPKRITELDTTRLRQKLARARKLRDKFRDLGDSQKRQIRGKEARASKGGPAQDNRNTRLKQQLFEETVERFEKALAKVEAGGSGASKKTTKKKVSKKAAKKVTKKAGKKKVSKKSSGSGASESVTAKKKVTKKAGKKAAKKTARASKKKVMKRASSLLGSEAPSPMVTLTPDKKRAIKKALASKETRRTNTSVIAVSEDLRPKLKAQELDQTGAVHHHGHVSSRTRRNQAKRDSR